MNDTQLDLFAPEPVATATDLFAEVVFDRPLDHAYTYGVPESAPEQLVVGKRVLVPFGRGDKQTTGFCVGITEETPPRGVKTILQVLDEEALLTPQLMKLTRWMADYYLCAWGQVLQAVVPAGVREKA